jgi:hypothetical protein
METRDCVIGVFPSSDAAQEALSELEHDGWSREHISLIARGDENQLEAGGPIRQGDEMERSWAWGATAGAAVGLLAGSALFIVPGLGPVLFAGAAASAITGGLVGGLVGAMSGWGVKEDHIREYEDDLKHGKTLIVLTGDPPRLAEGRAILQATTAEKVTLHAETADSMNVDA